MVKRALGIPEGRILRRCCRSPTARSKSPATCARAPAVAPPPGRAGRDRAEAWERQLEFSRRAGVPRREVLAATPPGEPVWVVSGRPYNLYDDAAT